MSFLGKSKVLLISQHDNRVKRSIFSVIIHLDVSAVFFDNSCDTSQSVPMAKGVLFAAGKPAVF